MCEPLGGSTHSPPHGSWVIRPMRTRRAALRLSCMATARINGVELFYELTGSGEPLVLVHGSWSDHHNWDPVASTLAESFRVLAFDRRGHSNSERPPGQGSVFEDADDLAGLIDELGLAPAHVAGNSFGAVIALRAATRRPEVFRSLIAHGHRCSRCWPGPSSMRRWRKCNGGSVLSPGCSRRRSRGCCATVRGDDRVRSGCLGRTARSGAARGVHRRRRRPFSTRCAIPRPPDGSRRAGGHRHTGAVDQRNRRRCPSRTRRRHGGGGPAAIHRARHDRRRGPRTYGGVPARFVDLVRTFGGPAAGRAEATTPPRR